jgi:hypothetical protein
MGSTWDEKVRSEEDEDKSIRKSYRVIWFQVEHEDPEQLADHPNGRVQNDPGQQASLNGKLAHNKFDVDADEGATVDCPAFIVALRIVRENQPPESHHDKGLERRC